MVEEEKKFNKGLPLEDEGPWWKPAVQLFTEVSSWIAVPIILALVVGKYFDKKYGTEPMIFTAFVIIGFLISAYGIIRSVKKGTKQIEGMGKTPTEIGEESKNKNSW